MLDLHMEHVPPVVVFWEWLCSPSYRRLSYHTGLGRRSTNRRWPPARAKFNYCSTLVNYFEHLRTRWREETYL